MLWVRGQNTRIHHRIACVCMRNWRKIVRKYMFYYVNLKHSWCDETKSIVTSGNFSVSPQGGIWLFAFSSVSFRAASNHTQFYNSNTRIFVVQRCLVSLITTLANYKNCKCSTRSNASAHFLHSSYKRVYTCHYCNPNLL